MKLLHCLKKLIPVLLLSLWLSGRLLAYPVGAEGAVVHAVLFYSPSCPHCHQVIQEVLPPLFERYGEQLDLVGIDVTTPAGSALFEAAVQRFAIPPDLQAVPLLIVGETILLGSIDIPGQFPGLIEQHLAQGGIDWPDIPGLREALPAAQPEPTATLTSTLTPAAALQGDVQASITPQPQPTLLQAALSEPSATSVPAGLILPGGSNPGLGERLARDPVGNSLAIIVLLGMLLSLAAAFKFIRQPAKIDPFKRPSIWIPYLCLIGLGVASYLAYVETAQVEAVCGPVGDCNTVQGSEYARLFGVLPVGILGMAGYVAILAAWLVGRLGRKRPAQLASLALLGMTLSGVLFSIYLTFLEPFVIGATCAWCLTSAVIMTLLLFLSLTQPLTLPGVFHRRGGSLGKM